MSAVMEELVVMSWSEARQAGMPHYFSGKPCKHGHIAYRFIGNRVCVTCNRLNSDRHNKMRAGRPLDEDHRDAIRSKQNLEGFTPEPPRWPDDGGAKRVGIYDHNFGQSRLVRRVGWTNCLGREPVHRIFSSDVARERICTACKAMQARGTINDYC